MRMKLLKSKRALKGVTQQEIARELGINTKSYNFKENGKSDFTIKEAAKVIKYLQLSPEDINDIFFAN